MLFENLYGVLLPHKRVYTLEDSKVQRTS